jgi:predicted N-acetyltransferase YhbS
MFDIEIERPEHQAAIEALLDLSFGPGRFAKTAQRLREQNSAIPELCYVAFTGEGKARRMVGSLRFWPVMIGNKAGLMLGPLAVEPALRGLGCGIQLMEQGLSDARKLGYKLVILVGDEPYYARVGFGPVPQGRLSMPGPVDPKRLLYRELDIGAFADVKGEIARPH